MSSLKETRQLERPWALINLPPLPAIAMRILQLLSRPDVSMRELSDCMRGDPAFASELLIVANSALFGFRTEVKSILQATALLGLERVKALALTVGFKVYLTDFMRIPVLLTCWRHSLACALVCEELAVAALIEKEFAYIAGLLHDIGRLALGMIKPVEYANLLSSPHESPSIMMERERDLFGVDHCEAGRWLVESWKMPPEFAEFTASHHYSATGNKLNIMGVVRASCPLADALGFEAVRSLNPPSFEEIVNNLPEWERRRFATDQKTLADKIATRINSLDA
jgi:HD-like signal output (HDOD) protein